MCHNDLSKIKYFCFIYHSKGSEDGCLQIIQASELSRPWVGTSFSAAILRWRCLKRSRVSLTIQGGAVMNRGGTGSNLRCIRQNLAKGF
jgi:hypothetical protein